MGLIIYYYAGKYGEAVDAIEKAMRLNPFPPNTYYRQAILAYCLVGKYEEAIEAGKTAVTLSPNDGIARVCLIAAYSLGGRQEEARIKAAEHLRLNPKSSLANMQFPFKNQADRELIINALRKAGLPE